MEHVFKPTMVVTPANQTIPTEGMTGHVHIESCDYARSGMKLDRESKHNPVKITILKNEKVTIHDLD